MLRLLTSVVVVALASACDVAAPGEFATNESVTAQALTLGTISPTSGHAELSTTTWSIDGDTVLYRGEWVVPLALDVGKPVPSISATVRDNAETCPLCEDGTLVQFQLLSVEGGATSLVANAFSSGSGTEQTLQLAASAHVVTATEALKLRFLTMQSFPDPAGRMDMAGRIRVGVKTLSLPLHGPHVTTTALIATIPLTSSSQTTFIPFSLPVGSIVTGTRATIADNASGPTRLKVGMVVVDGSGTGSASATGFGQASAGTGQVQTVESAPMAKMVQNGRWYAVEVIYSTGSGTASIKAAEVDYID